MTDAPPQIYACLAVLGTFDPSELTALLGADAATHRRGDSRSGGRVHEEDSWHFSTTKEPSHEWPGHLDRALDVVRRHVDEFVRFCDHRGLERHVHLIAEITGAGETPIGSFTAAQIAAVAALGCSVEVDLYCWPTEDE